LLYGEWKHIWQICLIIIVVPSPSVDQMPKQSNQY
jgi:hypothetical protein